MLPTGRFHPYATAFPRMVEHVAINPREQSRPHSVVRSIVTTNDSHQLHIHNGCENVCRSLFNSNTSHVIQPFFFRHHTTNTAPSANTSRLCALWVRQGFQFAVKYTVWSPIASPSSLSEKVMSFSFFSFAIFINIVKVLSTDFGTSLPNDNAVPLKY